MSGLLVATGESLVRIDGGPSELLLERPGLQAVALDPGIGTCGKNGQGVPVGVGQPTLRMERITVGGTA